MNNHELFDALVKVWPDLSEKALARIEHYYELYIAENSVQNLSRLISVEEFVNGHILDVCELHKSKFLDYPAMDLGSGAGIPGLISGLVSDEAWILCESERRKADFLSRATSELNLPKIRIVADRAEEYLKNERVATVVVRAVGPVGRIYGWIGKRSTWNTLILFKGPKWAEEWREFQSTSAARELRITGSSSYEAGPEKKTRLIIRLERVPRGTKAD